MKNTTNAKPTTKSRGPVTIPSGRRIEAVALLRSADLAHSARFAHLTNPSATAPLQHSFQPSIQAPVQPPFQRMTAPAPVSGLRPPLMLSNRDSQRLEIAAICTKQTPVAISNRNKFGVLPAACLAHSTNSPAPPQPNAEPTPLPALSQPQMLSNRDTQRLEIPATPTKQGIEPISGNNILDKSDRKGYPWFR